LVKEEPEGVLVEPFGSNVNGELSVVDDSSLDWVLSTACGSGLLWNIEEAGSRPDGKE